jgi:hypothetical protein
MGLRDVLNGMMNGPRGQLSLAQAEKLRECRASSGRYWASSLIKRLRVTTGEPSPKLGAAKLGPSATPVAIRERVGQTRRLRKTQDVTVGTPSREFIKNPRVVCVSSAQFLELSFCRSKHPA